MRHFVTIANRQVNSDAILGVEGALLGQAGKIRLYLEPRLASLMSGAGEGVYLSSAGFQDQPAILELSGAEAGRFREQWQQGQQQMQSATG
jgi:hypothetical protein